MERAPWPLPMRPWGAYEEGEREGVSVLVGIGGFGEAGAEGASVAVVVGGDVDAVGERLARK